MEIAEETFFEEFVQVKLAASLQCVVSNPVCSPKIQRQLDGPDLRLQRGIYPVGPKNSCCRPFTFAAAVLAAAPEAQLDVRGHQVLIEWP